MTGEPVAKDETSYALWLTPPQPGQSRAQWLYEALRVAIVQGRLRPATRIPSTRRLAQEYGVARGTVTTAYEQLIAEGYLTANVGAGTYVNATLPEELLGQRVPNAGCDSKVGISTKQNQRAQPRLATPCDSGSLSTCRAGRAFVAHQPALDLFPKRLWARLMAAQFQSVAPNQLGEGCPFGYPPLREAIAEYVGSARGIACRAEQVVVVSGLQPALGMVARVILERGDSVWMEDPGYPAARNLLRNAGAEICAVPVDDKGLCVDFGERYYPSSRLAYITPAHQAPLGSVMSLTRRLKILDWARRANAWIFEDDYDGEYRYRGSPVPSLCALDQHECVIHFGSFSKTLFPGLRLGYLVVPARLLQLFADIRSSTERFPSIIHQLALSEFIARGHYARHLRRMRTIYAKRHALLATYVGERLADELSLIDAPAGLDVGAWIKTGVDEATLIARARAQNVTLSGLRDYAIDRAMPPGVLIGFASSAEREIARGVDVLRACLLD